MDREHPNLSLVRQCGLLGFNRSSLYYRPACVDEYDLELMGLMGITAIYRPPNTSKPRRGHKVYPYLLRGVEVKRVNQVWGADITYIPMAHGFMYLVAIMDWHSRYVMVWRLSHTLDSDFCVDALEEALSQGTPEIFNTDQGSQFTSEAFTGVLLQHGIQISMDGKGRCQDNVRIKVATPDEVAPGFYTIKGTFRLPSH